MENSFFYNGNFQRKEELKKELHKYGCAVGCCVVAFLLIQEFLFLSLTLFGLTELYTEDFLFQQCFGLLATLIALCGPFFVAGRLFQKKTLYDIAPAGKPINTTEALLAVPAGVALCLVGNYATNIFTVFFDLFGVELSMPDMTPPSSGYELFIYFLRMTLVAGVIEEVSFRGVVLQPLRKFGNWFAIIMAAVAFALIHCNLIQAPFALVAGLVIGYFTVVTDSLWVGIAIHVINNGISAVISYLALTKGDDFANAIGSFLIIGSMVFGIICAVIFFLRRGRLTVDPLEKTNSPDAFILTKGEKLKAFFGNIPMILAIACICLYTSFYISL